MFDVIVVVVAIVVAVAVAIVNVAVDSRRGCISLIAPSYNLPPWLLNLVAFWTCVGKLVVWGVSQPLLQAFVWVISQHRQATRNHLTRRGR